MSTEEAIRETLRRELLTAVGARRRHELGLERANKQLISRLRLAHGNPSEGGLTYREMAEIVGLSRNRIIQLVQGQS